MRIKTLQWNIGGGFMRDAQADPMLESSYVQPALDHIAATISAHAPDIISLQEVHTHNNHSQAQDIAAILGWKDCITDIYDQSHLQKENGLAQAVLSRFPLDGHTFSFFYNPRLKTVRPNGETWISHNKGLTTCRVRIGSVQLNLLTLHLLPFRKFGVTPADERVRTLITDVVERVNKTQPPVLMQGDFNINQASLAQSLPGLFTERKFSEVVLEQPTTPKGRRYDHVVYAGITHRTSKVLTGVYTDHYPVLSEFEIA